VWTSRAMNEVKKIISSNSELKCIMAPFYLCVGDIYHCSIKKKSFTVLGKKGLFTCRLMKNSGVHWGGQYGFDTIYDENNNLFFNEKNTVFSTQRFWHMTHLRRSKNVEDDYSSGGNRIKKLRLSYFLIGQKIKEPIPEVFQGDSAMKLPWLTSFKNFFIILYFKFIT
jgi:hypothetical protein